MRSETKSSSSAALSCVGGRLSPTTRPSSGSHGSSSCARCADDRAQPSLDVGRRRVQVELERAAHQAPRRPHTGTLIPACAHCTRNDRMPAARAPSSRQQPGLAEARDARDDGEGAVPLAGPAQCGEQRVELGLAADERADRLCLALADGRADVGGAHELGLALGGERLDRRRGVGRARALEHVLAREQLPVRRRAP